MNCNMPIKAVSPTQRKDAVTLMEVESDFSRLAVQTDDESRIEELVTRFTHSIGRTCEILVKDRSGEYDADDQIIWTHYYGTSLTHRVRHVFEAYHNCVLHDGDVQFLVRNRRNGDYVCLDDHGILFFYLSDYEQLLSNLQDFESVDDYSPFVSASDHWHYRPAGAEDELNRLIDDLGLGNGE